MSIIKKMRKQKAIYWSRDDDSEDRFGRFIYNDPVEIDCRWDDCVSEYRDSQGQLHHSQAVVYVDRVMTVGDMLRLGALPAPDDPRGEEGVFEVKRFDKTPNLRATETLYTAYLS